MSILARLSFLANVAAIVLIAMRADGVIELPWYVLVMPVLLAWLIGSMFSAAKYHETLPSNRLPTKPPGNVFKDGNVIHYERGY